MPNGYDPEVWGHVFPEDWQKRIGPWGQRPAWMTPTTRTLTQEEIAGVIRGTVTAEGRIPYRGMENYRAHLESLGYELVESDEFGPLPDEEKYFVKREAAEEEKKPWLPAFPTTREAGGYTFVPEYDAEGNITRWQEIGRAPEAPEEAVKPRVIKEGLTGEQLRSLSLEFELWKSQALQDPEIAGPAGWIRRYMIEQMQDPFALVREREAQGAGYARKLRSIEKTIAGVEAEAPIATKGVPPRRGWIPKGAEERGKEVYAGAAEEYRRKTMGPQVLSKGLKQPTPAIPPTPVGLAGFVPGLVTGQPITKEPVVTPSGQQWLATPWSQREQLRGYTEWAGGRPYQDILDQMRMMIPEAPAGVAKKWYRPPRQV